MRRELLAPLVIVAVLLVAAGSVLAAVSVGGGSDDEAASEAREGAEPSRERGQEQELDRLLPELEPFIDRLLPELEPFLPRVRQQPFVGIALSENGGDMVVEQVVPGSPAARAGIHEGDVIEAVDDAPVRQAAEVAEIVHGSERGDVLTFRVQRDGDDQEIEVRVGQRPLQFEPREEGLRSLLPDEFLERFAFPDLRERLTELFERFIGVSVTFLDEDGERVTLRLVAGMISEAADDGVVVSPNGGGSAQEFAITEQTHIFRGLRRAHAEDLELGDRVVVVARGDDGEASAILAFPALVEGLER